MGKPNLKILKIKKARLGFRWYHLYFLLAAFDLITISVSLYLNHNTLGIYTNSVNDNRQWADRVNCALRLAESAALANAPGNDAFTSMDFPGERARLNEYVQKFQTILKEARSDFKSLEDSEVRSAMLARLDRAAEHVREVETRANSIFQLLEENKRDDAGSQMSSMDQAFTETLSELNGLASDIGQVQEELFQADLANAHALGRFEIGIGLLVILIVGGVTWYGHKLAQRMNVAEGESALTQSIVNSCRDGIFAVDPQGKVLRWNRAAEAILGYTSDDIIGQHWQSLVAHDQWPSSHELGIRAFAGHGIDRVESVFLKRDSSTVNVEYSLAPVWNDAHDVIGTTVIVRDITDRIKEQLEKERLQQELLISSRKSGMAEVATGVLHNLGNALNSLQVSVNVLDGGTRESPEDQLVKVAKLLDENIDRLPEFLGTNQKGKSLAAYLAKIGELIRKQKESRNKEYQFLKGHLNYIVEIVDSHRGLSDFEDDRLSTKKTIVDLNESIRAAVAVGCDKHADCDIHLELQSENPIPVQFDPQKLKDGLAIIVANHAMSCLKKLDSIGQLTIRCEVNGATARILSKDNGAGCQLDKIPSLFCQGFAKSPNEIGWGLHNVMIQLQQANGSLTCIPSSDQGGLSLQLELPVCKAAPRQATAKERTKATAKAVATWQPEFLPQGHVDSMLPN